MKKKIPIRKCVACNEGKPKKELVRIVKNNLKEINVDITGKMNGRGAYICPNLQCLELAYKNKKLNKSLEADISDEVYEKLKETIEMEK